MQSRRLLWHGVLAASEEFPDRAACEIQRPLSYRDLLDQAKRIAATIQREGIAGAVPLSGVFGNRSEIAYAGVLGTLMTQITAEEVRRFLLNKYADSIHGIGLIPAEVGDDFDFLVSGVIDSFGVLDMSLPSTISCAMP